MLREGILAFSSGVLLYVCYLFSADWIYGIMLTEITDLANSYAVTNPTLKTQIEETYTIVQTGYKLGIIMLWIAIVTVLIIVTQRREPREVYYGGYN